MRIPKCAIFSWKVSKYFKFSILFWFCKNLNKKYFSNGKLSHSIIVLWKCEIRYLISSNYMKKGMSWKKAEKQIVIEKLWVCNERNNLNLKLNQFCEQSSANYNRRHNFGIVNFAYFDRKTVFPVIHVGVGYKSLQKFIIHFFFIFDGFSKK